MKFNHLIEINDPLNPLIDPLTREQLWRGLVLRAEDPVPFLVGLDGCRIVERSDDGLRRELQFGALRVLDRVRFEPMRRVHYETDAQDTMPAATLVMTIEEPGPGLLFVRFEYDSGEDGAGDRVQEFYDQFRRNAYQQADIDTIKRIRQLADEGLLNGVTH